MERLPRICWILTLSWITMEGVVFGITENATEVTRSRLSTQPNTRSTNSMRINARDNTLASNEVTRNQNHSLRCIPNPCLQGRVCSIIPNGYRCECPDGWMGQHCVTRITCSTDNPCLNKGRCYESKVGILNCICPLGFTGQRCGYEITTPCDSDPCVNGKVCVENGSTSYRCQCPSGYAGDECDVTRVGCIPNACENNGTCIALLASGHVSCICQTGFAGSRCEIKDPCQQKPCMNGGSCKLGKRSGEYKCDCSYGYTGQVCEYGPCFSNPCLNGGICALNRSSCLCMRGWQGDICNVPISPATVDRACVPNPCRNGCQCKPSCRHENGYICQGSEGQLGKNCDLPAPSIKCGPNEITVRIDRRIVAEYGGRYPDVDVFMSNTSSIVETPSCPATSNGTVLQFALKLPFNDCGTASSTISDGTIFVTNTIWMNKLFATGNTDVPIPIVKFVCQYDLEYNIVTSLLPSLDRIQFVVAKGERAVPADIELCKSGESCPRPCPTSFSLTSGAVYTVGEKLHLRISSDTRGDTLRIQELFLSCSSDVSQEQSEAPVTSMVSECLPTKSRRYNPTEVTQFSDGLCISFRVPFLSECGLFYIHAKLKSCYMNCSSYYGECNGRSRRSVVVKDTVQVFGPIHVLRGNDGVLKTVIYPGDDNRLDTNSTQPTETPAAVETLNSVVRIVVGGTSLLIVCMLPTILLCIRRYINGKRIH